MKKHILAIVILGHAFINLVNAQTSFQIGFGTTFTSGYPMLGNPNAYTFSRAAAIYRASELTASGMIAGNISQIAWHKLAGPVFTGNLSVYFKHTTLDLFPGSVNWATEVSGATTVFSASTTLADISNWINISLSNPFNWDGVSNIVVMIEFERTATISGIGNIAFNGEINTHIVNAYTANSTSFSPDLVVLANDRPNTKFVANGIPTEVFENATNENSFVIFPNPTVGQFTIVTHTDNAEIIVTDILSQLIIKTKATQETLNLQLDNTGVYIVHRITNQGTTSQKLIVNH
ncbi:MAG: T9SS type A sorting domain-containing protein [Bacteroidia bacterium]